MRKYSRIVFALIVLIKSNTSGQLVEQYPPADYSNPIEPGKLRIKQRDPQSNPTTT